MPFKIVQTIEDGQTCLSIVPSSWENSGILFWPNSKALARKLQKQSNSLPDNNKWHKMVCIKKREFSTFKEAEMELEKMEAVEDTDIEVTAMENGQINENIQGKENKRCSRIENNKISQIPDFNCLVPKNTLQDYSGTDLVNLNDVQIQPQKFIVLQNDVVLPTIPPVANTNETSEQLENIQEFVLIGNNNTSTANNDNITNNNYINQRDGQLLHTIVNNQNQIINQQAKMQSTLETLVGLLSQYIDKPGEQAKQISETANQSQILSHPINTEEDLNELEERLKDAQFGKLLTKQFMFICGSDGKANGVDCAYKLIDYFLTREFIDKCSWTGNTRNKENSKTALKYYKNFRKTFLELIRLADNQFSEVQCDIFFKRILKNSSQRMNSNICSTHKSRPRNLKYKPKQSNQESSKTHAQTDLEDEQCEDSNRSFPDE